MREDGGGLGFALKATTGARVGRQPSRQHLHRDFATEPGVSCPIDLAHAARPEWSENFVGSELVAG